MLAAENYQLDDEIARALQERLGVQSGKSQPREQSSKRSLSETNFLEKEELIKKTKKSNSQQQKQQQKQEQKQKQKQKKETQRKYLSIKKCHDVVIGTVPEEAGKRPKYKKTSDKVVSWRDDSGKMHFGASAPSEVTNFSSKIFENVYSTNVYEDYFDLAIKLDLHSAIDRSYYKKQLYQKIKNMYEVFIELLPNDTLLQVNIKLWVFDSLQKYRQFYWSYYPRGNPDTSLGFYSGRHYIAAARNYSGKQQVVSTSIHEATHVFNHANFGVLPRWLNEGLGEYIEQMGSGYPSFAVEPNHEWLAKIKQKPLSLQQLFSLSGQQWNGASKLNYYAHSWALVYFLMSSEQGKKTLSKVLQEHAKFACDTNFKVDNAKIDNAKVDTRQVLLDSYQGGFQQLEKDFDQWLYAYKELHHYKR